MAKKKIIVCCDGTWMNSDNGTTNQTDSIRDGGPNPVLATPTNVTRIARCVAKRDSHGNDQITYYQAGLGTHDLLDKVAGGSTGLGLSENIRAAYQFIASNYNHSAGDEIYLVGFSRGSFTARSIAAFIADVGLLTPLGMVDFYPIFEDWENQIKALKPDYKPHFARKPFEWPRPNLFSQSKEYTKKLAELGYCIPDVKIRAVACYDTVGSLGLPRIGVFDNDPQHHSLDYSFVDTTVPDAVDHAIHALALDERREPFAPTMWELPNPREGQTLTQCWFVGGHADVGGSFEDTRAADISLTWMVSQLSDVGVEFDYEVLKSQYYVPPKNEDPRRHWSCGAIHDTYSDNLKLYFLGGINYRTPMHYDFYDHDTGLPKKPLQPLRNTNEMVHSSVRLRSGLPGKAADDKLDYHSHALEGWKCHGTQQPEGKGDEQVEYDKIVHGQGQIYWEFEEKGGEVKRMPEAVLSQKEYELLRSILPSLEGRFLSVTPKYFPPTPRTWMDKMGDMFGALKQLVFG